MELSINKVNGMNVMTLSGRLDASTCQSFEESMVSLIGEDDNRLILHCQALSYVSSAGLRSMLMAMKKCKAAHGFLFLCEVNEHVNEILQISGFSTIFPMYPSLAEALAAMAGK